LLATLQRRDRQLLDALTRGAQVVLWFEHDLYDQLQVLDLLTLVAEVDARPDAIVVDSFPGKPRFVGLGELNPDELETLWPARVPVLTESIDAAAEAWAAVRASAPTRLAELVLQPIPELPFAASALRRLLEELPAPNTGLSTTERLALTAVRAGATTPHAAFVAAQQEEVSPFLGDTWFARALAELGHGAARLVETQGGHPLPAPPPLTDSTSFLRLPLRITDMGERVLSGEADRVELLGISRWVGGTNVSKANLWRWDPATLTLER
jgi:hypothetical protein